MDNLFESKFENKDQIFAKLSEIKEFALTEIKREEYDDVLANRVKPLTIAEQYYPIHDVFLDGFQLDPKQVKFMGSFRNSRFDEIDESKPKDAPVGGKGQMVNNVADVDEVMEEEQSLLPVVENSSISNSNDD